MSKDSNTLSQSKSAISMRNLRIYRAENHLCTRCGGELPPEYTKRLCQDCKTYINDYNLPNPITNEELAFFQFKKRKTPPKGEFGRRLKKLMLLNIESPLSLSKFLCVSTKTIDSWLYRKQIPSKSRWHSIALHFGCDVDDLGL